MNKNEHYVEKGITSNSYSEAVLEDQCDKLFTYAPIEFAPTQGSILEEDMHNICQQHNITIPIIAIRDKLYLVGSNRMTCDFRSDSAMIKVGGGYQRFDEYILKNQRHHQKRLVTYMINNQASLEWVVSQLMEGKNIQTGVNYRNSVTGANGNSPIRKSVSNIGAKNSSSPFNKTGKVTRNTINGKR